MNLPNFSVIITCRNYGLFVSRCIESVLSQDYLSREIIVVDADSTDNSSEIISSFKEVKRLNSKAGSHVWACEKGFENSVGKWILFLDADDFLLPGALYALSLFSRDGFVKIQYPLLICTNNKILNRSMVTFPKIYNSKSVSDSFNTTGTYLWPCTSGNVFARSFLSNVFPLDSRLPVDGQLNTIAPCFGGILTINKPFGCYRLHNSNMDNRGHSSHDLRRFSKNIFRRYREVAWSRRRSRFLHFVFPKKNPINFELPFLSYRLFLKKVGAFYFLEKKDTVFYLFCRLIFILFRSKKQLTFIFLFFLWHAVLLVSPRPLALWMIKYRFNRDL